MHYITKAQQIAKATPPRVSSMTSEQLETGIGAISDQLKGHGIGHMERIALNEDRKAMRSELARRQSS